MLGRPLARFCHAFAHRSVMVEPVVRALLEDSPAVQHARRRGDPVVLVDGTAGGGGHAAALLQRLLKGDRLLALDRDPAACAATTARLAGLKDSTAASWSVRQGLFGSFGNVLDEEQKGQRIHGIVLDLGPSQFPFLCSRWWRARKWG